MQPCQPQEPAPQLQAGRSWDSSNPLDCLAPLDASGDFRIESLFPEFYDDDGIWSGGVSGMSCDGLVASGMEDVGGFGPGVSDQQDYGTAALYNFNGMMRGESSFRTTASPISIGAMPSALPTPASASHSEPRPANKKRPASDSNHSSRTRSPASETSSNPPDKVIKRQRNTEAARRYRQRKVDRVTELEEALAAMTKERDDFKLKLARSEAEADVLRRLVGKGN